MAHWAFLRVSQLLAGLAVAFTLWAALTSSAAAPSKAPEKTTLRYAEDRAPAIINPLFATSMSEARVDELVFDGLFSDDPELRSRGRLVASFEQSPDLRSMRLNLRPGVLWHDGFPFGAEDVRFTVEAYRSAETASSEAGRVSFIDQVAVIDDHTVRLTFRKPEYAPQDKLHFKILPSHAFESTAVKRTDPFRTKPLGTGPYSVAAFNEDNSITLVRNPRYWEAAHIDELVLREISDSSYQAKLLLYESLEALVRVLPRDLALLQNDRKVELYPYQTNSWWYFGFNLRKKPFTDPRVREALSRMIDADALLAPIGTGERVTGPFVPSSPFYNHEVAPTKPDPSAAIDLLTAAGYRFDGKWRTASGQELVVRLVAPANVETAQDVVINVQSQLQSQGITVEPEFLDVASWKERVWNQRSFDLVLSQWSFDRNEDIWEQFHSGGSRNFTGFADKSVDGLLQQARDATDPQRKKALLRDAHRRIAEAHPMVFLWTLDSYAAFSTRVRGVVVHPFYFFTWISDWTFAP